MDCQRILASDFGWKHGIPPENEILSAPHAKHTLFVCVAKHPLAWLGSLVSRPYNPAESAPSNFSDFIRYDWPLSPRDNLPDRDRINVVELWNAKNSAFLNLSTIVDRCIVVAYERILEDPAGFLDRVACHLLSTREKYVWSLASTKGDETTFEEYREKYLTERIDDAISADDLEFVRQRIDFDLLESFGYTWPAA